MPFVCDAMLGRTARFLRLLGYDTLYDNMYSDLDLLKIAKEENRVLLTRDIALHQQAVKLNIPSCLLLEKTYVDRITSLILKMNLKLELNPSISRCATCNAKITPVKKGKVKGKIPEKTYVAFDKFWICTNKKNCGKIYYQGPHWMSITKTFEQIMKNLKL
ncbi:MAG: Mut7-C RNAse domain-containing protein [Promethearchaeota archaeon]